MWNPIFRPYLRAANIEHRYSKSLAPLSRQDIAELKQLEYFEQWKLVRERDLYHLYFGDHSFFIFKTDAPQSYSFYDCPIDVSSISEYLIEIGEDVTAKNVNIFQEEYDSYLATANLKKNVTPIRYDFDDKSFRSGVHPAAHIHIGLNNQIRIGLERQLTPLAFLLIIIRQMYPEHWERLLNNPVHKTLPQKLHINLEKVPINCFGDHEKCDLYLTKLAT
jgi:hypothetical protein